MTSAINGNKTDMLQSLKEVGMELEWTDDAKAEILSLLADSAFPCIFAKKAASIGSIRWKFHDSLTDSKDRIVKALQDYTDFVKSTPANERLLAPLVVVVRLGTITMLHEQHNMAWSIIQYAIDHDPLEWPQSIPMDPGDYRWCLCFNQVQLFVNISAPGHMKLRSRNLGSCLCLVFNPRENFDIVAPRATSKGLRIRGSIRERIKRFNQSDTIPDELGFFGDEGNLEWKQYRLAEAGALEHTTCPLTMKGKGTRNAI